MQIESITASKPLSAVCSQCRTGRGMRLWRCMACCVCRWCLQRGDGCKTWAWSLRPRNDRSNRRCFRSDRSRNWMDMRSRHGRGLRRSHSRSWQCWRFWQCYGLDTCIRTRNCRRFRWSHTLGACVANGQCRCSRRSHTWLREQ